MDQLRERLEQLPPEQGYLYLDGPSGAGKTRLLREFADATPGAVLVDAAGCTAEQIADRVIRALGVPYNNDQRSLFDLYLIAQERDLSHVVILTNTQWAGTTRHTDEPWNVAIGGIVAQFGIKSERVGVQFIMEVDTEVSSVKPRSRPIVLAPDHGTTRWSPGSLSSCERAALNALALSERHHVRFDEWQALCSVLGADFDEAELRTIAAESPLVTVDPSAHRPIGFTHERDARTLRSDIPAEAYRAFQHAITDRLFACTDDDPLDSYLAPTPQPPTASKNSSKIPGSWPGATTPPCSAHYDWRFPTASPRAARQPICTTLPTSSWHRPPRPNGFRCCTS
ncbi:ATP-binding protein [Streptomyces nigra]|uniref:ATP-binding protein n=1 Tax=Streptomyces nigra TaxID=1827580 RepID=UPI0037FF804A